ncbi:MAG: DUF6600 domain-containing protein [Chthoniobacterales bacterium]
MKKILITLLVTLFVFSAHRAQAEVTLDFFYDSLADDGDWFEADDYGYCWQPRDVGPDWSPYTDGYWTYTDAGWTWVSYESFGWATYHYGRWANLRDRGWVWVPGYEWGPAWVSWRSSDEYVGWAPLPARAVVSVGFSIGSDVDEDYDIGPEYYHFASCRRFGSPSLRQVIVNRSENVTIINQTTNITNITYRDNIVYNGGPDFDRINRRSERPIERLRLERITRLDNSRDNRFAHRGNGRLTVVAPAVVPVERQLRPRNIKASLGRVQTEHGWSGVRDPKQAERIRAKIREENKGRTRGPVNRDRSVVQALRTEARRKQVADLPDRQPPMRPNKRPDVARDDRQPVVDPKPEKTDANGHSQAFRENQKNKGNAQTRENHNPRPDPGAAPDRNADEARQREAAARRRQAAEQTPSGRGNQSNDQELAQREREKATRQQAERTRSNQADAQARAEREQQLKRREAANASRQNEDAARQQAARRASQDEAAQATRARAQREEAAQQRQQQIRQQQAQEVRRQSAPERQARPEVRREAPQQREARPQPRPQVQQSRERAPQPSSDAARDERNKKKKKDDDNR